MIQSLYRGNFTMYGIPLSQYLGGPTAAASASAVAAATLPVLNILAVLTFACCARERGDTVLKTIWNSLKNPILWGVLLGLAFSRFHWALPAALDTVAASLAGMASPFGFLMLGTRLWNGEAVENPRMVLSAVVYKLLVMPVIFLPAAVLLFQIRGVELIPAFLFVAAPSAITTCQPAPEYGADQKLAGNIVTLSTVLPATTISLFAALLRYMALI